MVCAFSTRILTLASFPLTRHSILLCSGTGQWICKSGNAGHFIAPAQNVIHHWHLLHIWIKILKGISTKANISPVGIVIDQLQGFNELHQKHKKKEE